MATILQLTTVHPRSDTRIFIKEAQTLASNLPHKVLLMVADGKGNVNEGQGQVSVHDLGTLGSGRLHRTLIGPLRAFSAIRRLRPAIVHFHDPELIFLGMLLRMIGYKVIYDVHENVPGQILSKQYVPWLIRRPVARVMDGVEWFGAKAFDAIIPATPKIADRFPAFKTVVIHNFPIANELLLTDPIPYNERPQSFVYPGVIAEIRGAVEMVRALELLHDIPGARLDLAGTFSPYSFFDTLQVLPVWSRVNYHGEVTRNQLAHLLGGARAGLVLHHPIPNEIDAQPIKMFEYMAAGIPIIASDLPPLRKIINEEGCGLIVKQSDPKAIGEAMRWILDHPAEAEAMGRNGRQAVELNYNWGTEVAKIISLYEGLLIS